MPIYPFFGEGSPTKIDVLNKVGTLLASLLEDLVISYRIRSHYDSGVSPTWPC